MADSKISGLTDGAPADATDEVPVSRTGGITRKLALSAIRTLFAATFESLSNKDAANGYAGLSAASKLTGSQQTYGVLANTACEGNDARLSDTRNPNSHATSHQNGGGDEISIAGLSGEAADPQPPKTHATNHQNGGTDEISVTGLSGLLADAQTVAIHKNGTIVGTRKNVNFIEGTNVTLTIADDGVDDEVDVTINASGVGGYTNEEAQDAVGTILVDTATVDFTYDDVTPQITADVKDNSITDGKLRDSAALSVIGRAANSTGDPADIAAGSDDQVLRRSGTAIAFGAVNLAGANAVTGDLPLSNIAQASAASRLLGRGSAAGAGDFQEITLGSGLSMSGTELAASGGGATDLYNASGQNITAAGFVDVTGMTFSVAANKAYFVEAYVIYTTSSSAMGCRFGINGPTSPTAVAMTVIKGQAAVTGFMTAYDTADPNSISEGATSNQPFFMRGLFVNGANAGTFALRMDKENVAGTFTIVAASMRYKLLN